MKTLKDYATYFENMTKMAKDIGMAGETAVRHGCYDRVLRSIEPLIIKENGITFSKKAKALLSTVDYTEKDFSNYGKFTKLKKANDIPIYWEHKTTNKDTIIKLMSNPSKAYEILKSIELSIITSEENDKLNSLGYMSNRECSDSAYAEANIELVEL